MENRVVRKKTSWKNGQGTISTSRDGARRGAGGRPGNGEARRGDWARRGAGGRPGNREAQRGDWATERRRGETRQRRGAAGRPGNGEAQGGDRATERRRGETGKQQSMKQERTQEMVGSGQGTYTAMAVNCAGIFQAHQVTCSGTSLSGCVLPEMPSSPGCQDSASPALLPPAPPAGVSQG